MDEHVCKHSFAIHTTVRPLTKSDEGRSEPPAEESCVCVSVFVLGWQFGVCNLRRPFLLKIPVFPSLSFHRPVNLLNHIRVVRHKSCISKMLPYQDQKEGKTKKIALLEPLITTRYIPWVELIYWGTFLLDHAGLKCEQNGLGFFFLGRSPLITCCTLFKKVTHIVSKCIKVPSEL